MLKRGFARPNGMFQCTPRRLVVIVNEHQGEITQ